MSIERYRILKKLGEGGMGTVFKAHDLFTGELVALKQVLAPASTLEFSSMHSNKDGTYALAGEFRALAGLHHPNIVAVLDYGFDSNRTPYYTMQLLSNAKPLTAIDGNTSPAEKIRLLIELLQALTYLHRLGIIHRDLKPANVLITDQGVVKVLDFGLAISQREDSKPEGSSKRMVGTYAYIAPEVFRGESQTIQSDLYAVGVMAYELFAGRHPFNTKNRAQLITSTVRTSPDFQMFDDRLGAVLSCLLSKAPSQRYNSADDAIRALCEAADLPVPVESAALRESFLQASAFVGRTAEMEQLREAMKNARAGQGSAWLIGGESGIGKSRLMEEIRTHALVEGALVLRGQAFAEGGLPYQLWRDPVRRLVPTAQMSDLEASVLKEIVPDISVLLSREVPDAPVLTDKPGQERLIRAIINLFRQQIQPIVLLLEDAQWASESLTPLRALSDLVGAFPLLILVSYRDDETPDLPSRLPAMGAMTLPRFSPDTVRALSTAMLGEAGDRPDLVERLHEETEGNVFFLVEVMRAFAEEAGSLSAIATQTLPKRIVPGGVLQITRRRLSKIPESQQEALKLAAVAGRQIDLPLLAQITGAASLDDWLMDCAHAAVLNTVDGSWRFAHDKLRETVLTDLSEEEQPVLHRRVAQGIEAIYPSDVAYAEALAAHWEHAGEAQKAVEYILQAAERLVSYTAEYTRAEALLGHGLDDLTPAGDKLTRARLYYWLGNALDKNSELQSALQVLKLSVENCEDDPVLTANALNAAAFVCHRQGNLSEAAIYAERALTLALELNDLEQVALAQNNLGGVAWMQGRFGEAWAYYEEALANDRKLGSKRRISATLNNSAIVAMYRNEYEEGRRRFEEAMHLSSEIGHRAGLANARSNLAMVAVKMGDYPAAQDHSMNALEIFQESGTHIGAASALLTMGNIAAHQGDYVGAEGFLEQGLSLYQTAGSLWGAASCLIVLASNAHAQGSYDRAERYVQESLALYRQLDRKQGIASTLLTYGMIDLACGRLDQARMRLEEGLQIARDIATGDWIAYGLLQLCLLAMQEGDLPTAQQRLRETIQAALPLDKPQKVQALIGAVELLHSTRPADVTAWIALLESLPQTKYEYRCRLVALMPTLEAALGTEGYQAAYESGKNLQLDQVLEELVSDE